MKVLLTGGFAAQKYYLQVVLLYKSIIHRWFCFMKVLLTDGFAVQKYYLQVVLLFRSIIYRWLC
jgi:hypothetical protein